MIIMIHIFSQSFDDFKRLEGTHKKETGPRLRGNFALLSHWRLESA